jgi:hypothetical protein
MNNQNVNMGNVQGPVERPDLPSGEGTVVICGKAEQYKVTGHKGKDAGWTLKVEIKPVDFPTENKIHRIRITGFNLWDNSDVTKCGGYRALRNMRALCVALMPGASEHPVFTTTRANPDVPTQADLDREAQAEALCQQVYQGLLAGKYDGARFVVKCTAKRSDNGAYFTHKFFEAAK